MAPRGRVAAARAAPRQGWLVRYPKSAAGRLSAPPLAGCSRRA
jgi:hypothetical protein